METSDIWAMVDTVCHRNEITRQKLQRVIQSMPLESSLRSDTQEVIQRIQDEWIALTVLKRNLIGREYL